jgi:pyruvate formate lyase activating enzyme
MKKSGILFDIKKFAIHDGPGIRTTVFFKGCPLECWWCHNPESRNVGLEIVEKVNRKKCLDLSYSETKEYIGREITTREVMKEIEKDQVFYDESAGGVTFSGGEPLLQYEFLLSLLSECAKRSIHTAVDTSGYAPAEILKKVAEKTDLFLYDLKIIDNKTHEEYIGVSNDLIFKNLEFLFNKNHEVIVRIPIVPGITNSMKNINGIINFLLPFKNARKISLLAYNKLGIEKYKRLNITNKMATMKIPTKNQMTKVRKAFEEHGFKVSIGG